MNTTTFSGSTPSAQWRGVRHGRVTRSMFSRSLSIRARYILSVLTYLLEYEKPQRLSQARIAEVAEVSEGTVSLAMDELALAGRIRRDPVAGGGYELTLVRPLELRQAASSGQQRDQMSDPAPERPSSPPAPAEEPIMRDQMSDPSIIYDHADLEKKQEGASFSEEKPLQDPLYQRLMQIPNMHEPTARRAAQKRTGSVAEFERDVERASEMPGITMPAYFVLSYWLTGERLPQRAADPPPPTKPQRENRQRQQQPEVGRNVPLDPADVDNRRARLDALMPDANADERLLLNCALDEGLDGDAALAWVRAELARGVFGG